MEENLEKNQPVEAVPLPDGVAGLMPPGRKRPKWLVPLIAGGTAVVVLAAGGTAGYLYWNHRQLTEASEECSTVYDKAVKSQEKLTDYLKSDAVKAAISVKDSEVKDAKTVTVLASTVKAASNTKTTVPECPSGNVKDIQAVTAQLEKTGTAYMKTVDEVANKAEAVNGSKLDKIVADATKILNDSKGKVKDDKTRTALENAIKTKDEKTISDAVKAVNDSIKAKTDADAKAKAEKAKQTTSQAQASDNGGGSAGDTTGGYTGYTGGGYTQSQGGDGGGYTPTPQPTPQPSQGGGNGGGSAGGDDGYEDMCGVIDTSGKPGTWVPCD